MGYAITCFFCGEIHSSDYWDDIDVAIEKCRGKAGVKDRGDLAGFVDQTRPIRCETEVPRDPPFMQERAA